jgi:hypothetical protein
MAIFPATRAYVGIRPVSVGRLVVDTFVCPIGQPGDDAGRYRHPVAESRAFALVGKEYPGPFAQLGSSRI